MAKYGIVAGRYTEILADKFEEGSKSSKFVKRWENITDLIRVLINGGNGAVVELDAILIMDGGFSNTSDGDSMAITYNDLQQIFYQEGVRGVKLYVVTDRAGMFQSIKNSSAGDVTAISYENAYCIYFDDATSIKAKAIIDILDGKMDDYSNTLKAENSEQYSRAEKLNMEFEKLEKEFESDEDEIITFNQLSHKDAYDSKSARAHVSNETRRRENEVREIEKESRLGNIDSLEVFDKYDKDTKRDVKLVNFESDLEETEIENEESVDVDKEKKLPQTADKNKKPVAVPIDREMIKNVKMLKNTVEDRENLLETKIVTDEGAIIFTGVPHAGTSGLVAQTAEVYASYGRKVLIIDLDVVKSMQTVYFPQYYKNAKKNNAQTNSLINVLWGSSIKDSAISVTSRIDILSIGREEDSEKEINYTFAPELSGWIREARKTYDMVLIDIPIRDIEIYLTMVDNIEGLIISVDNKEYSIEILCNRYIKPLLEIEEESYGKVLSKLEKAVIVLNKVAVGMRMEDGIELKSRKVREIFENCGYPIDRFIIIGEVPYYDDWEYQYMKGGRKVVLDESKSAMNIYKGIVSRVVRVW